jgi:predicted ferric reductase
MNKISRNILYGLWLCSLLVITGFWMATYSFRFSGSQLSEVLISLAALSGFTASYLLLTQLFLIGSGKFIESKFGLDRLSSAHAANGKVAFFFIFAHIVLMVFGYLLRADSPITNFVSQYLSLVTSEVYYLLAGVAWVSFLVVIITSIVMVRKKLPYELWHGIHFLAYLSILLPVFHQVQAGNALGSFAIFKFAWIGLYIVALGGIILFRYIIPAVLYRKYNFRVDKIEKENGNVSSIYIAGDNLDSFKYDAGQFAMWRFFEPGLWWQPHPFTISSAPGDKHLRITVKNIGNGSVRIQSVKTGTRVMIQGPYGIFEKPCSSKKRLFIAGGIGITPINAMLQEWSTIDDILVYGAQTDEDLVLLDELKNTNAKILPVLSRPKGVQKGEYISGDLLKTYVADLKMREVWLCGPVDMIDKLKIELIEFGVSSQLIHIEKFRFG